MHFDGETQRHGLFARRLAGLAAGSGLRAARAHRSVEARCVYLFEVMDPRLGTDARSDVMMILIAGPHRSGTGDDPGKMAANVEAMERYALPLFRAGHVPIVGEWLALPLVALADLRVSATRPSTRSSIQSRSASYRAATPCCGSAARKRR